MEGRRGRGSERPHLGAGLGGGGRRARLCVGARARGAGLAQAQAQAQCRGAAVRGAGGRDSMAATFFGEVVKAPCRAGTEDEEEEAEGRTETPEDREVRRQLARKR